MIIAANNTSADINGHNRLYMYMFSRISHNEIIFKFVRLIYSQRMDELFFIKTEAWFL